MITTPTVLILGAGASQPYGFPLGGELLQQVCDGILKAQGLLRKKLLECDFQEAKLRDFATDLQQSYQPSVDAFLEKRSEFLDVGKAAIAAALVPCEKLQRLRWDKNPEHWYRYLFQQLTDGAGLAEFEQNRLSVLTYNYDRSLEQAIFSALKATYGLDDSEATRYLKTIEVVHLHGSLGKLPYGNSDGRPYLPDVNAEIIKQCASTIKVMHEDTAGDLGFERAASLLSEAEVVCFLGFGYHRRNVERLPPPKDSKRPVYGTTFKMADGEIKSAYDHLKEWAGDARKNAVPDSPLSEYTQETPSYSVTPPHCPISFGDSIHGVLDYLRSERILT